MESIKFCDEASALIEAWKKLPKTSGMLFPRKGSFSPQSLGKYLRSVFLFEFIQENDIQARVAGTSLREFLGLEITGKNVLEIYPPAFQKRFETYYSSMRAQPCAGYTERPYRGPNGAVQMLKSIQLPLGGDNDDVQYYVGIVKSFALSEEQSYLKSPPWDAERDMLIRYVDIGASTPST